jgi:hypothetical protein
MNAQEATLIAAVIAASASVAKLFFDRSAEGRLSIRSLLLPLITEMGEAVYGIVATSSDMVEAETDNKFQSWYSKACSERDMLKALRPRLRQGCLKVFSSLVMQWRNTSERQHPLDVVGQLSEALPDRAVAATTQKVHHDGAQEREHRSASAVGVAMGVLTELGIAGPVPFVLNAPALPDQSQQGVWAGADAGDEPVVDSSAFPLAGHRGGDHLRDPGAAGPVRLDVLRRLFRTQYPERVTTVFCLPIRRGERDMALALELATDLAIERLLVAFHGEEDVGPLLQAPSKNGCVVWRASAWMRTPSNSSVLRSSFSAARSLDS